ncbi:unnamed protein product [Heligmosomoides polygyrus]|uniref:Bestrophin homolog n=1 Tax=Heligmosomoides polygyrus TaxID=6339 RepID=A0A183G6H2_HELPZ|nr:unnamed protein product [Heligmosomoides polygyrus]
MHHRKQRTVASGATTVTAVKPPRSDFSGDAMARLRFLKKPLCLQYMISSQCAKRHQFYKSRPKEQSLLVSIVVGLVRLMCWLDSFVRNELWHFITAPAVELDARWV